MGTRRRSSEPRQAPRSRGRRYFIYRPPLGYLDTVRSDMCGVNSAESQPDLVLIVLESLMGARPWATSSFGKERAVALQCQQLEEQGRADDRQASCSRGEQRALQISEA